MRQPRFAFVVLTVAVACSGGDDASSLPGNPAAGSAGAVSGGAGGAAGTAGSKAGASAAGQAGAGAKGEPFGGAAGSEPFGGVGGGGSSAGGAGGAGAGGAAAPVLVPPPPATWAHAFGGPGRDYVFALAPTSDGGVYAGGYGRVEVTTGKVYGGFVVRYASDGTLLWAQAFPGAFVTSLAVDSKDQVIVGGGFDAATDFAGVALAAPKGQTDGFVAKLTTGGVGVFAVAFASEPAVNPAGDRRDMVYSVSVGKDDRVFAVGAVIADLLTPVARKGAGSTDLLVAALDAAGAPVFAELVGGAGDEQSLSGCVQPSGQLAVVPSKRFAPFTFAGKALGAGADDDIAHLFFAADGAPLLAREYVAPHDQAGIRVACHADGGLVMVGAADSLGVVSRFDASGALLWVTPNPFPSDDSGPAIPGQPPPAQTPGAGVSGVAIAPDGRIVVAGTDRETNMLFSLAATGNVVWGKQMGPYYTGEDELYNPVVAVNAQGEIFYAGSFSGTFDFGDGPHSSTAGGQNDAFIAKLPAPP